MHNPKTILNPLIVSKDKMQLLSKIVLNLLFLTNLWPGPHVPGGLQAILICETFPFLDRSPAHVTERFSESVLTTTSFILILYILDGISFRFPGRVSPPVSTWTSRFELSAENMAGLESLAALLWAVVGPLWSKPVKTFTWAHVACRDLDRPTGSVTAGFFYGDPCRIYTPRLPTPDTVPTRRSTLVKLG